MRILVVGGPVLDRLHLRDPAVYGGLGLEEVMARTDAQARGLGAELAWRRADGEGEIVGLLGEAGRFDGVVVNPGGYAHTSVAVHDALEAVGVPKIEVHLSNTARREGFRGRRLTARRCDGIVEGLGWVAYAAAVFAVTLLVRGGGRGMAGE